MDEGQVLFAVRQDSAAEQLLAGFVERPGLQFGKIVAQFPRLQFVDGVVGIDQPAQQGQQLGDTRSAADLQGVFGQHADACFKQGCRRCRPFLVLAHKNRDVLVGIAFGQQRADVGNHSLQGCFLPACFPGRFRQECEPDKAGRVVPVCCRLLLDAVVIDLLHLGCNPLPVGIGRQDAADPAEHVVVEVDQGFSAPPVFHQRLAPELAAGKVAEQVVAHQPPVRSAPAVDGLLDVAHHEIAATGSLAFPEEGTEIVPLHQRGVLGLVEHEMLVAVADFLIDERSVVVGDDPAEQVGGQLQQHHVVFPQVVVEYALQVAVDAQQIEILPDEAGGVAQFQGFAEVGADPVEHRGQGGWFWETLDGGIDLRSIGDAGLGLPGRPFLKDSRGTAGLFPEIIVSHAAVRSQQPQPLLSDGHGLLLIGRNDAVEFLQERFQRSLVTQDIGSGASLAQLQQERFIEELLGHLLE